MVRLVYNDSSVYPPIFDETSLIIERWYFGRECGAVRALSQARADARPPPRFARPPHGQRGVRADAEVACWRGGSTTLDDFMFTDEF